MAGLLDFLNNQQGSGGLLGNMGGGGFGGIDGNTLLALGAGLASGNDIGQGIGNGLSLAMQQRALSQKQATTQQQQMALYQALTGKGGLSHAEALAGVASPDLAKIQFARMYPELKPHNVGDVGTAFNPVTGGMQPQFTAPSIKTVPEGQSMVQVTPTVPGLPQQPAGSAVAPTPTPQVQTIVQGGPKFDDVTKLRNDLAAKPALKRYEEAAPIYNSMVKSFGNSSRASDLDFVYGMAKIFDPESVVREGEMVIVNSAQSLPASVVAAINRLNAGQGLQEATRRELLGVAKNRMGEYRSQADTAVEDTRGIATRNRMNTQDVIPTLTQLGQIPEPKKASATDTARGIAMPDLSKLTPQQQLDLAPQNSVALIDGQRMIKRGGKWVPFDGQ